MDTVLNRFKFTEDISKIISNCKGVTVPKSRAELISMAFGAKNADSFEVNYEVNGEIVNEATIVRCKNGIAVNFPEDYMRRRDPDCMIVADDKPTDRPTFKDVYKKDFAPLRNEMLEWLTQQELIITPFLAGGKNLGCEALLITPKNLAFFACLLADLQCFANIDEYKGTFTPKAVIYLAPPFRHTHFNGRQVVVHNRLPNIYEMFANNLYPGPSAKKGVYSFIIDLAEKEGWVAAHASAVKLITPYDNEIVIMHEGASGGGKSEMGENIHRASNGKILVGKNLESKEEFYINLGETCELRRIADDIALCHPKIQNNSKKLVICDGEDAWFLRFNHILEYGTAPFYEKICTHPSDPLVFLSMQGVPNSTCLIWEHTLDSTGKPTPNPRVILPRRMVPDIIDQPVEVDIRSFGVRTPPSTAKQPNYGILGILHIIPPALAWLWRLTAPRGHNNPSIDTTKRKVELLESEGVGSYGPFLSGKIVNQANLLLEQMMTSTSTRYVLIPNQHIGCYNVGFMPEWLAREYMARRGSAKFKAEHLSPARLPLLGFCLESLKIDGQYINKSFLRPELQPEMGVEGYDAGAEILTDFFKREIVKYNVPGLNPIGKQIIEMCLNDAPLEDYIGIIPIRY